MADSVCRRFAKCGLEVSGRILGHLEFGLGIGFGLVDGVEGYVAHSEHERSIECATKYMGNATQ
jgi:hypothetical protein